MSKFETIKEPIDSKIHFVAEALPRSYGFKVKWTKEKNRLIKDPYKIFLKVKKLELGETQRMYNLEPSYLLYPKNYKWDVRIRNNETDKIFTVEISLHYIIEGQTETEPFAEYHLLECKSYINEKQFHILYNKAIQFCAPHCGDGMEYMRKLTHFYRSDKIIDKFNIDRELDEVKLMGYRKLAKQGHLVPGVNRVPGIFFFARNSKYDEPNVNTFSGESYAKFTIEFLIDVLEKFNFYFMDLKCYSRFTHYIAIAIAKIGTDEDRLIKLDKFDNPFLCVKKLEENVYEYYVPGDRNGGYSKCFIEVFFMGKGPLIVKRKDVVILDPCWRGKPGGNPTENCPECCLSRTESLDSIEQCDPSNSFINPSYLSTPEPDENELKMNNDGKIEVNGNERGIISATENNPDLPNDMPSTSGSLGKRGHSIPYMETKRKRYLMKHEI